MLFRIGGQGRGYHAAMSASLLESASIVAESRGTNYQLRAKRALDLVLAVILLLMLIPILVVLAALVCIDSPGPVLFRQRRIGAGGRTFVMYKFRTMYNQADTEVHAAYYRELIRGAAPPRNGLFKVADDQRVTPLGRILRRFSLDELPQLFNVLSGDMSLVGPRPPIPYEVDEYGPRERLRLRVVPGLTGLWQVSGRSRLTFQEMIDLDLRYIDHWSIWLDLWIMLRTPLVMLRGSGAS
jgi:lipopolysaccharide/colanic/teichoic acid biosynthesis glycosyltransferase